MLGRAPKPKSRVGTDSRFPRPSSTALIAAGIVSIQVECTPQRSNGPKRPPGRFLCAVSVSALDLPPQMLRLQEALRQVPELRSRTVAPGPLQQVPIQPIDVAETGGLVGSREPQVLECGDNRLAVQKAMKLHRPLLPAARTLTGEPSVTIAPSTLSHRDT